MKAKVTYPYPVQKKYNLVKWVRWSFLLAAYICVIVNICTGGRAWSAIVLWSLWIVWSLVFARAIVEYNRISQFIKAITDACILLIMIDVLLAPGWAIEVVPIVCFSGLIISAILFFTDIERQKQNMMPMLLLTGVSLICSVVGLIVWKDESRWALITMGALALALPTACICVLGGELIREFKKRFHTK